MSSDKSDLAKSMDRISALIREAERIIGICEIKVPFLAVIDGNSLAIQKINGVFRITYNDVCASDIPVLDKIWVGEHLDDLMEKYQAYLHQVAERARNAGRKKDS